MPKNGTTTKKSVRLFTSESVCAGHPDKICDAISDAIVDAAFEQDPRSHTAIETVAGANQISLYGEIKTTAKRLCAIRLSG
jgi:S-adenosylmethionine synthetase